MLLTGHEGEVFATKFSTDGNIVASAGFDRLIRKFCLLLSVDPHAKVLIVLFHGIFNKMAIEDILKLYVSLLHYCA